MVVVLPNKQNGIHLLARDFPRSLNDITNRLNETEIFVSLPRFSIEYNSDLVKLLPKVFITIILQNMSPECCNLHNISVVLFAYGVGVNNQDRIGPFRFMFVINFSSIFTTWWAHKQS